MQTITRENIDMIVDVLKMKSLSDRIVRHPQADEWICYILSEYAKKNGGAFKHAEK